MSFNLCGTVVESIAYALAYAHPYASLRGAYANQALMHLAWITIGKRVERCALRVKRILAAAHKLARTYKHNYTHYPSGTPPLAYAQLTRSLREAYAAGGMHNSNAKPNGTLMHNHARTRVCARAHTQAHAQHNLQQLTIASMHTINKQAHASTRNHK